MSDARNDQSVENLHESYDLESYKNEENISRNNETYKLEQRPPRYKSVFTREPHGTPLISLANNGVARRNYTATYQLNYTWTFSLSPFQECVQPPQALLTQFEDLSKVWVSAGQRYMPFRILLLLAGSGLMIAGLAFIKHGLRLELLISSSVTFVVYIAMVYLARMNACGAVQEKADALNAENSKIDATWSKIRYEYYYRHTAYFIDLHWRE